MSQPEKYTGPFFRKNAVAITAEELFRSFLISQTRSRAVFTAISLPYETHIAIIEVGGTVGDIESQPFLEAIRQFQHEVGHENAILIHVTLILYIKASGELKTKPTQASVKELQGMGIQPDIIVCRSEHELDQSLKDKIALFL